jgi:hypothetical protein
MLVTLFFGRLSSPLYRLASRRFTNSSTPGAALDDLQLTRYANEGWRATYEPWHLARRRSPETLPSVIYPHP